MSAKKKSAKKPKAETLHVDPVVRYAYAGIPLDEVATLAPGEYIPRGATPLNDAVCGG